jgi:hypothetical protein
VLGEGMSLFGIASCPGSLCVLIAGEDLVTCFIFMVTFHKE